MFLYLMLNKPNYRKSQLNQSLSTQIQLKYLELNIKWGQKYALISALINKPTFSDWFLRKN